MDASGDLSPAVRSALSPGALALLARIAQADLTIRVGSVHVGVGTGTTVTPASGGSFSARLTAQPAPGQARDPDARFDESWAAGSAHPYGIEIGLSGAYTFRASTLAQATTLLVGLAVVALGLAVIVAAALARRFTTPVTRLTEAARALAEGDLSRRVEVEPATAGGSELADLARQFNTMADRLQESVAIIRRDRDRSRDFLADVSHELRTPIAALRTFVELLQEQAGTDPEARREFLEASAVQLERLDWLAQNLLELSRLESGLVLLDLRPEDVRTAVASAVEQAEPTARRRGVDLRLVLPDHPVAVRHDPQRIGQVLTNLVGNAVKFTPGGGRVTVELRPAGGDAELVVGDTGVGIDPSELPRIFDRFYRGSRASEARGSGSGLGLAIVKSIVDMHRGRITVDSRVGEGSTFRVLLPADPRNVEEPARDSPTVEVAGDDARGAAGTGVGDAASGRATDGAPGAAPPVGVATSVGTATPRVRADVANSSSGPTS